MSVSLRGCRIQSLPVIFRSRPDPDREMVDSRLWLSDAASCMTIVRNDKKRCGLRDSPAAGWWLVLALLFCLATTRTCLGDASEFTTAVWSVGDGLPDNSVTSLAQTRNGYLWIGTLNGLARFDGVRFAIFNPENTPALQQARVDKLFLDKQGTLWINTHDGSLTSLRDGLLGFDWPSDLPASQDVTLVSSSSNSITFSQVAGDFIHKSQIDKPTESIWEKVPRPVTHVRTLSYGNGKSIAWEVGSGKRLWRLVDGKFDPMTEALNLLGDHINCVAVDRSEHLWVGTDKEIAFWDGTRFQNATPTNGESQINVDLLLATEDGGVWSVANNRLRKSSGFRWVGEAESLNDIFAGGIGRTMCADDHHGGLWLYNYGQGLSLVSPDGQVKQFGIRDGFPPGRVNCLLEDREGDWWAGIESGGLVRLRSRQFLTFPEAYQLFKPAAKSVCEDTLGDLWVATLGGGLDRWRGGVLKNLTLPGGQTKHFFFCVCADANNRLWTSAGDENLYVLEQGEFRQITPLVHGVKVILADHIGRIWAGTTGGLFKKDPSASDNFKLVAGSSALQVRALVEDSGGVIWIGCEDGTIFRMAGDDEVTAFRPPSEWGNHSILALLAENDGSIWAGTYRGGLLRLKDGKFTRFTANDGLPDNFISQVLADDLGSLWLGSHRGVFCVAKSALDRFANGNKTTIPCVAYGQSDGLPSLECSSGYQPSACRDREGRLWFATAKGAASVQPRDKRPNLPPPPVLIEEMVVDGRVLTLNPQAGTQAVGGKSDSKFHLVHFAPLEIAPGKHRIEIRYTGLSLASPDRVQFRYRLEGADQDWVWAGTQRFAEYSLLPPGQYEFQVFACNSDNVWSEEASTLEFLIRPHFYQTLWFLLLVSVLVVGFVAGTVRHRVTVRLRRKLQELERIKAIERERTRIAQDIHDDLGSSLTLIAVLGDIVSHEKVDERLGKISNTARQAVKSLDEIVWAVNPRNDTLGHLIDYAGQFAVDYLLAAGINCFLDVPENPSDRELPSNIRHNVFLAIKEALQNIVKHAQATDVWLKVGLTPEGVQVVIEDNGRGFAQAPDNALADGLRNMRQRMSEIGGECLIESRIGGGTTITLVFLRPSP